MISKNIIKKQNWRNKNLKRKLHNLIWPLLVFICRNKVQGNGNDRVSKMIDYIIDIIVIIEMILDVI